MIYGVILIENGRVKRRNENTTYLHGFLQKSLLCPALGLCRAQERKQLVIHLLALAEQENVDKIGHRLRI